MKFFEASRIVPERSISYKNRLFHILAVLASGLLNCPATPASWPTYRANQARNGFCKTDVSSHSWTPAWYLTTAVKPQPAWPAPARASLWQNLETISPRQREDLADVPLIVTEKLGRTHVVIGSSGEDCVRSFSAEDGSVNWEFPLLAPVRFAPVIDNDVVYFGCDDGFVRAINLLDGNLIWQTRVGPKLPWIVGNGRVISPHPVRTSLLIFDDKIIAHAGLFPSQGVYAVAIHRENGELIWRRKTETSPQGYLLADDRGQAIVPTGRAQPYLIELSDGAVSATLPSPGGSFCMFTPRRLYTGPGNQNQVSVAEHDAEKHLVTFQSQAIAAANEMLWTADGQQLVCYRESDLQAGGSESLWSVPSKLRANLIVVGTETKNLTLFVVGGHQVHVYNAATGQILHELAVEKTDENLIHVACSLDQTTSAATFAATSTSGTIYVWRGDLKRDVKGDLSNNDTAKRKTSVRPLLPGTGPPGALHKRGQTLFSRTNAKQLRSEIVVVDSGLTSEESDTSSLRSKLGLLQDRLPCTTGLGLLVHVDDPKAVQSFLKSTNFQFVVIARDEEQQTAWREQFLQSGDYGHRVCVWPANFLATNTFERGIFNVVVVGGEYTSWLRPDKFCADDGFLVLLNQDSNSSEASAGLVQMKRRIGGGVWRHQYASPDNSADGKDAAFVDAVGFRLQWFGGVGPRQIPDRHLRGAAPLVAGSSMIVHGDGCLIGVDPANGLERWQLRLPEGAMRYVIPFDSGYSCLTENGSDFYVAANAEIWRIEPKSGIILNRISAPSQPPGRSWGYLSEVQGDLFATLMNSNAPRYSQDRVVLRKSFVNDDYNSGRPLVCSTTLLRMNHDGETAWQRESKGVIPNSTISVDKDAAHVIFVEGMSDEVQDRQQARFTTSQILRQGTLVCLDADSGKQRWQAELDWSDAENMLYTLISDDCVVLVSSISENERAIYLTKVFDLTNGHLNWEKRHVHVREGLFHGEQVHHPVALKRPDGTTTLVVEPYMYDLLTGSAVIPAGMPDDWLISRPGHSCGTMTGAADCLFFRANNPTAFNLNAPNSQQRFTKLSPSRPSCWINMVPAAGRLFIPEGSASCVCQYSLQTSMAFSPVGQALHDQHWLEDVLPNDEP